MADYATNMAALPRHGHLVSSFFANIFPLFKEKKVYALQEQPILEPPKVRALVSYT